MTASVASSTANVKPPWQRDSPSLEALECGEAELQDIAWHHTLNFIEDLWASAAASDEPDANLVPVRVRPLFDRLAGHIRDGFPRLRLDDLQRAAFFLAAPLRSILDRPNTRLSRVHEYVPWERVEELDARSLLWMSRLPGRTTREKSATTRRALGVVRKHSLAVEENRVLVRLAADLIPLLERRLGRMSDPTTSSEKSRNEVLTSLLGLLQEELPRSPLGKVRPALRPAPNNALLGSGEYGKIWRAWRWLELRTERFAQIWRSGLEVVGRALGLLVAAHLGNRRDAMLIDDLAFLGLGGAESMFGLTESASFRVLIANEDPRAISVRSTPDSLEVVTRDGLTGRIVARLEVARSFDPSRTREDRGIPVRVAWLDVDRDVLGDVDGWFDAAGVDPLVTCVVASLGLQDPGVPPRIIVAGSDRGLRDDRDVQLVALDLASAEPVIASEGGVSVGGCAVAIDVSADDGHVQRVVGEDALAMDTGRSVGANFFLSGSWEAIASGECDVASLASALGHAIGTDGHPDRQLCFPVPDGLGEPGEALLRSALLPLARRIWLVPRSAAIAMAYRAEDPTSIAVDAQVLVLDCGPFGFEGRLIALRAAAGSKNVSDALFWECPLPWPSSSESRAGTTRSFWRELARDCTTPDASEQYIDRVVDSGLAARLAADSDGRSGACLFGDGGKLGPLVRINAAAVGAAAQSYATRFRAWVDSIARDGALADLPSDERSRLHVLVAGEVLAVPQVAALIHEQCCAALGEASIRIAARETVARGGIEFLKRMEARCPTFELALPDLFLKSIDATGRAASRPIFQKQRVRPGQVVAVAPIPFELPAGVPRIELPLEREPGGRRPLAFRAVLDGEGFPLRAPLRVDLVVEYRYAEDGFRLRIRPRRPHEATAVLADREVRWLRRDAGSESRVLNNEPPGFPSSVEQSATSAAATLKAIAAFRDALDAFLNDAARRQGGAARDVIRQMEDVSREVAALVVSSPRRQLERSAVSELADAWVVPLCLLADCSPEPYPRRRAPRWAPKANEIRKQLPSLRDAALASISRLRGSAPVDVPKTLVTDAERLAKQGKDIGEKHWMSIGRTVSALTIQDRRLAVGRIVQLLCARPLGAVDFGAWWALATALWSESELVLDIDAGTVEALIARIEATLDQRPEALRVDLLHELGIVLMALLRRRGKTDAGPVDAGTPRLRGLADSFEDIERALAAKRTLREPRLKIAAQNERRADVSTFMDALTAALRGERVALIRRLED